MSLVGQGSFPALANGRHFDVNPDDTTDLFTAWPVGHHQPWGQIFVQDTGKSPMVCDNVTFLFAITVQECYDCFYLNSFISDATFKSLGVHRRRSSVLQRARESDWQRQRPLLYDAHALTTRLTIRIWITVQLAGARLTHGSAVAVRAQIPLPPL